MNTGLSRSTKLFHQNVQKLHAAADGGRTDGTGEKTK